MLKTKLTKAVKSSTNEMPLCATSGLHFLIRKSTQTQLHMCMKKKLAGRERGREEERETPL